MVFFLFFPLHFFTAMVPKLFWLIIFSSALLCLSYEPRNPEVEALIHVKAALNDPHAVLSNWDEDSVDPCSWAMITCSPDNLVIGLGAPSQSLSGTLSGAIGNLTNLRQVLLQNNNISGQIPIELGALPLLQTLDLSENHFSGPIPASFGQLNGLRYLRVNNNSLSGPFPVSLAKIPQLAFLDLSFNNLSGPVPVFPARTFNVVGNPMICGTNPTEGCSGSANAVALSFSLDSSPGRLRSKRIAVALGVSLSCAFLILLAFVILWRRKNHKTKTILDINVDNQEVGLVRLGNLRNFSFKELQLATGHFSSKNILGAGGFGNVYKGKLGDGSMVAVKRLKDVTGTTGESQFRTELEMISLAVHRNLLRLIGYCATSHERLLVYPYMSNGSVASRLRGKPALDWNTRKRIAIGAARGLLYLHEQCVMLEWVKKIQQEKKVELLVDRELGNNYDQIEVGEMLQVALICTQYLPAHRPKMSEVVRMLEGDGLVQKWAASHTHNDFNVNLFHSRNSCKSTYNPTYALKNNGNDREHSSMLSFTMDDDDDERSLDSYAMELSGPR
ncbi:putative LRR receptor-like serine/threonine-protein kinase, partial [Cucurbita argyrosperma subsp. sororia]